MPHASCLFCWCWILFASIFTTFFPSTGLCILMHADKYAVDWPATSDGPTLVLTRTLHSVPSHGWNTGWFSITDCFISEKGPGAVICYLVLRGLGQLFKKYVKYLFRICIFVSYVFLYFLYFTSTDSFLDVACVFFSPLCDILYSDVLLVHTCLRPTQSSVHWCELREA